jgi:hypothetical protein
MMKVIITISDCGHASVCQYTIQNLKGLLKRLLEENEFNTFMDDPEEGYRILTDHTVTASTIETFILDYNCPDRQVFIETVTEKYQNMPLF